MVENWLNAVESTLLTLSGVPACSEDVSSAFSRIAREWAHSQPGSCQFPSGITPDGAPVEASAQVSPTGRIQIRVIAQPNLPSSPAQLLRFLRQRAVEYIGDRSGRVAATTANRLLDHYPNERGPIPSGNFFLWLGASLALDGSARLSKLYLNPWAALPHKQGALFFFHLLHEVDRAAQGIGWIKRIVSSPLQACPHIAGCDFDDSGIRSLKFYFAQTRCSRQTLEAPDAPWADPVFRCLLSGAPQTVQAGEVHVALTFRRDSQATESKINLFCSDWFPSDVAVLEALKPLGVFDPLWERSESLLSGWRGQRRFTFVSASSRQATLYCRVSMTEGK